MDTWLDVDAASNNEGTSLVVPNGDIPIVNTPNTIQNPENPRLFRSKMNWRLFLGHGKSSVKDTTSPIWLVVLILVLTRVEQIGIKEYLTKMEPNFAIVFGSYATFRLSASLVLQLNNILTYPQLNWK